MSRQLRNGTYLREPDGICALYYSPYSFADAAAAFRKRGYPAYQDDGWQMVTHAPEAYDLWLLANLSPGEYVFIRGGEVVSPPTA